MLESNKVKRWRKCLFFILIIVFVVTYFTRNDYRSVTDIDPEVLRDPIQTKLADNTPIEFVKNGFSYKVTPLYDYDIAGLVVHHLNYNSWYSLSRVDSVFPLDLCVIWGDNIKSGAYQNSSLSFSQDYRFCMYQYLSDITVLNENLSNNHLVINDAGVEKLAESINTGDQIRIKGKLVDVVATPLQNIGQYESSDLSWQTSISRYDTGAGACEVIYVESLEILKKGNPISVFLFGLSGYGILIIIVWVLFDIFFGG